jgi:hypothetical protein
MTDVYGHFERLEPEFKPRHAPHFRRIDGQGHVSSPAILATQGGGPFERLEHVSTIRIQLPSMSSLSASSPQP